MNSSAWLSARCVSPSAELPAPHFEFTQFFWAAGAQENVAIEDGNVGDK